MWMAWQTSGLDLEWGKGSLWPSGQQLFMVAPYATCERPPRPLATQPAMFALEAQPKTCIIPAASGSQILMTQYTTASGATKAAAGAPAKFNAEHLNMLAGLQQSATSFQRQINQFSETLASYTEDGLPNQGLLLERNRGEETTSVEPDKTAPGPLQPAGCTAASSLPTSACAAVTSVSTACCTLKKNLERKWLEARRVVRRDLSVPLAMYLRVAKRYQDKRRPKSSPMFCRLSPPRVENQCEARQLSR